MSDFLQYSPDVVTEPIDLVEGEHSRTAAGNVELLEREPTRGELLEAAGLIQSGVALAVVFNVPFNEEASSIKAPLSQAVPGIDGFPEAWAIIQNDKIVKLILKHN